MNYSQGKRIKAFYEIDSHSFTNNLTEKIKNEIESKGKQYILGIDEDEYKKYLTDKYALEPLILNKDHNPISQPLVSKEVREDRFFEEKFQIETYNFTVEYSFTGSSELFGVRPSSWAMTTTDIVVNHETSIVSFSFKMREKDVEKFNREKLSEYNRAFANIVNINNFVRDWNSGLSDKINRLFNTQKTKYLQENDFFAAINIKVNENTSSVFTTPTIKKKIIPQPEVSKNKTFSSEPMMSQEMYDDILKVIYESGKNMEKKPALYQGKDEEGLRDQFLFVLETRYEGTTASGETFNRSGKTDIILKYAKDGSNLFVAECKFWHGESEFLKAISQLFDRYLTWRDSKVAGLMFVKNKDFTNVIKVIESEIVRHPYFVSNKGKRGETSFSYTFRLPQDEKKPVSLEVMAFHYDK